MAQKVCFSNDDDDELDGMAASCIELLECDRSSGTSRSTPSFESVQISTCTPSIGVGRIHWQHSRLAYGRYLV
jgi:hypothetical protein